MNDSSPPPSRPRRPWRFWEISLLLLSSGAIVLLFSLAISQDRTRVESFFRQATVTAVALAAQPTAAEIARAMPTQPPATVTQIPSAQAAAVVLDGTGGEAISDEADVESAPALAPGPLADEGEITDQSIQTAPEVEAEAEAESPASEATQQAPTSTRVDQALEPDVFRPAPNLDVADAEIEATVVPDVTVTPAPASLLTTPAEPQLASAAAAVAAGALAADEEPNRALRLPSPTPAPILQPALQTVTPAPEIGAPISSTGPISALVTISLTGTPVGSVLAPTPAPEIGVPISLTVPATVTATPGAADISSTPLPPEIGEPISATAIATLVVTAPATSTAPSLPVLISTAITTTIPATDTAPIRRLTPTPVAGDVSITSTVTGTVTGTATVTSVAPIAPTRSPLQPTSTATAAPSPTATPAAPAPTATSTSSPTPAPTPTALAQCPTGLSGSLEHQAKYYGGPIAAYNQDERMAVVLTVYSAPPGELGSDRLNLYLSDRAQFTRIVEEADQPREHHIEAGVPAPDATNRLVAAIGRPVGDFYLTIVNDSGIAIEFCLTIENGFFQ